MKFTKLMLSVLLVLAGCGKATPEAQAKKTAETFINALDSGDTEKAKEESSEDVQKMCDAIESSFKTPASFSSTDLSDDAKKKLAEIEKEIRTSSFENPKIKDVKEVNERKYEVTFSMDFLDTADIRKYFAGEEYKALISTLSVEATEMQKKDGDEAAKKYMMEQLVDKIYSVYTEQLKDKKYNNEDSIITLEQQDDGKWFVTDIKDAKQGK
ncbi:hypothetical protein [Solobacterium sp.]|uniref:hypothetical protein n=1 Tax=Solobacterium sp. TaxID=2060878 RepID=UPI001CAA8B44|nr:hypothetical protein [Solobacterium sp.]MBF1096271.1 hypothetical protein [Solobacterium sp.]MBF1098554.1 hypothetical protein [Solobacterium sp.]